MKFFTLLKQLMAKVEYSRAQRFAKEWEKSAKELIAVLGKKEDILISKSVAIKELIATIEDELKKAKALNVKYETALDALRNENKVMSEVTIPALTASCQLGLERWRAETAIQVRRQVAASNINKESSR